MLYKWRVGVHTDFHWGDGDGNGWVDEYMAFVDLALKGREGFRDGIWIMYGFKLKMLTLCIQRLCNKSSNRNFRRTVCERMESSYSQPRGR